MSKPNKPIKTFDFTMYDSKQEIFTLVLKVMQDMTLLQLGDSIKIVLKDREFVLKKTEETVNQMIQPKQ